MLFVDTFNGTFESENALAAARVLKAAGYTLHTVDKAGGHHCCGRTFLASGMVDEAQAPRRRAGRRAAAVRRGRHRHRRARAVVPADAARRGAGDGPGREGRDRRRPGAAVRGIPRPRGEGGPLRRSPSSRCAAPILLHGHCHQKAFGAVAPILDVLRLIPGAKPELIETSCCGMAGSFGYEAATTRSRCRWPRRACCRRCAARPTPSSSPTAPAAATRSPTARGARRCTWRGCSERLLPRAAATRQRPSGIAPA